MLLSTYFSDKKLKINLSINFINKKLTVIDYYFIDKSINDNNNYYYYYNIN